MDILILDEPTSALDPSAREQVLALVKEARAGGQTVIFSGHVLSEVEQVADRVAIMRLGRLMHVEDMHQRRRDVRLVLVRFEGEPARRLSRGAGPGRSASGTATSCCSSTAARRSRSWRGSATQAVADLAIGTEDLRSLYDRYHGPQADRRRRTEPEEVEVRG